MARCKIVPEVEEPLVAPYYDHNKRTCLQLVRVGDAIKFIELDVSAELSVKKSSSKAFNDRFKPIVDYPVDQAVAHFRRIAGYRGATPEAQKYLGIVLTTPKQESEMPTTAKKEETPKSVTKAKTKGPPAKVVKKPMSAAQRFQELIMEGKHTDDQIFAKVQREFDLDDGKKGYVKWYRNYLRKQGKKPPEPKVK